MIRGERIQELLDARQMSQAELARRVGMGQSAINGLIHGKQTSSGRLHRIARELHTTTDYLTGETDDPGLGSRVAPQQESPERMPGATMIDEVDLTFGLGGAFDDQTGAIPISQVPFPTRWLDAFTSSGTGQISVARGRGDSMIPTIADGDFVLFDRMQQRIDRQDSLWALAVGDILMFKRVRAMRDGSYEIHSDNPNVRTELAVDGEMHVIGRVIAVIQRK